MTPEECRRNEVTRWLEIAARDLHAAELLSTEEPGSSVFHSQQCAEKSLKALLTMHGATFRRTHDLAELGKKCSELEPSLTPLLIEAADLTDYATVFRYLDAPRDPDNAEADAALATARNLFDKVRALLTWQTTRFGDRTHA